MPQVFHCASVGDTTREWLRQQEIAGALLMVIVLQCGAELYVMRNYSVGLAVVVVGLAIERWASRKNEPVVPHA